MHASSPSNLPLLPCPRFPCHSHATLALPLPLLLKLNEKRCALLELGEQLRNKWQKGKLRERSAKSIERAALDLQYSCACRPHAGGRGSRAFIALSCFPS